MSAGLDSIAATELVSTLGQNLSVEIEPTALFDHPTVGALRKFLAASINAELISEAGNTSIGSPSIIGSQILAPDHFIAAHAIHLPTSERSYDGSDLEGMSR